MSKWTMEGMQCGFISGAGRTLNLQSSCPRHRPQCSKRDGDNNECIRYTKFGWMMRHMQKVVS
eukprot:scaffold512504_cov42-Prasinocladus_malaysianus.AAC.1